MSRIVVAPMIAVLLFSAGVPAVSDENGQKSVKKLVFDERRIEGKIRRPQLVLIKAEQRPDFVPMVLQSLGKTGNIAEAVEKTMLERSPYDGAFSFRDKRIVNYIP
ncbi:MAG: hypothetical protein JW913_02800 [Chitinispirillaceae bacterium]|nr:hypothetical protein [Chitinispirillaceae bacterium]